MASKLNLKKRPVDSQKDPCTPCSAARQNDGKGVNVADEAFQHDHRKCIEVAAQQPGMNQCLDCVLPGHDHSKCTAVSPQSKEEKTYSDDSLDLKLEDSPRSVFSLKRKSSPSSPMHPGSPGSTSDPKSVNFELKKENDPFTPLRSNSIIKDLGSEFEY